MKKARRQMIAAGLSSFGAGLPSALNTPCDSFAEHGNIDFNALNSYIPFGNIDFNVLNPSILFGFIDFNALNPSILFGFIDFNVLSSYIRPSAALERSASRANDGWTLITEEES